MFGGLVPPKPAVNEISSPTTYTDTDDYIVLYYIVSLIILSNLMVARSEMIETCN
jgi:hypothetical protein